MQANHFRNGYVYDIIFLDHDRMMKRPQFRHIEPHYDGNNYVFEIKGSWLRIPSDFAGKRGKFMSGPYGIIVSGGWNFNSALIEVLDWCDELPYGVPVELGWDRTWMVGHPSPIDFSFTETVKPHVCEAVTKELLSTTYRACKHCDKDM